eukprot:scaffold65690_cov29-Tisochrysis_lutea.AAC.3
MARDTSPAWSTPPVTLALVEDTSLLPVDAATELIGGASGSPMHSSHFLSSASDSRGAASCTLTPRGTTAAGARAGLNSGGVTHSAVARTVTRSDSVKTATPTFTAVTMIDEKGVDPPSSPVA